MESLLSDSVPTYRLLLESLRFHLRGDQFQCCAVTTEKRCRNALETPDWIVDLCADMDGLQSDAVQSSILPWIFCDRHTREEVRLGLFQLFPVTEDTFPEVLSLFEDVGRCPTSGSPPDEAVPRVDIHTQNDIHPDNLVDLTIDDDNTHSATAIQYPTLSAVSQARTGLHHNATPPTDPSTLLVRRSPITAVRFAPTNHSSTENDLTQARQPSPRTTPQVRNPTTPKLQHRPVSAPSSTTLGQSDVSHEETQLRPSSTPRKRRKTAPGISKTGSPPGSASAAERRRSTRLRNGASRTVSAPENSSSPLQAPTTGAALLASTNNPPVVNEELPSDAGPSLVDLRRQTDEAIRRKLRTGLTGNHTVDRELGKVYIFCDPARPALLKIGQTTLPVRDRAKQIRDKCGHQVTVLFENDRALRNPLRAEQLVHTTFDGFRRPHLCACGTEHREWFEVDVQVAERAVLTWSHFVGLRPYDYNGELKNFWKRRLDAYDIIYPTETVDEEQTHHFRWERFVQVTGWDEWLYRIERFDKVWRSKGWSIMCVLQSLVLYYLLPSWWCVLPQLLGISWVLRLKCAEFLDSEGG